MLSAVHGLQIAEPRLLFQPLAESLGPIWDKWFDHSSLHCFVPLGYVFILHALIQDVNPLPIAQLTRKIHQIKVRLKWKEISFLLECLSAVFIKKFCLDSDLVKPQGSRKCFAQTSAGIYLDRPNSYFQGVNIDGVKEFTVGNTFFFKIKFTTTEPKGIFLLAYVSSTNFILFDIFQGRVSIT